MSRVGQAVGTAIIFGALTGVASGITRLISPDKVKWVAGIGGGFTLLAAVSAYRRGDRNDPAERTRRAATGNREVPTNRADFAEYVRWAYQQTYGYQRVDSLVSLNEGEPENLKAIAKAIVSAGVPNKGNYRERRDEKVRTLREIFGKLGVEGYAFAQGLSIPDTDLGNLYGYISFCDGWGSWRSEMDLVKALSSLFTAGEVQGCVAKWETSPTYSRAFEMEKFAKALEGNSEALKALGDEAQRLGESKVYKQVLIGLGTEGFAYAKVDSLYAYLKLIDDVVGPIVADHFSNRANDGDFVKLLEDIEKGETVPDSTVREVFKALPADHPKLKEWAQMGLGSPKLAVGVAAGLAGREECEALVSELLPDHPWLFFEEALWATEGFRTKLDAYFCNLVKADPSQKARIEASDLVLLLPNYCQDHLAAEKIVLFAKNYFDRERAIPLLRKKLVLDGFSDKQIGLCLQVIHRKLPNLEGEELGEVGAKLVGGERFAPLLSFAQGSPIMVYGSLAQQAALDLYCSKTPDVLALSVARLKKVMVEGIVVKVDKTVLAPLLPALGAAEFSSLGTHVDPVAVFEVLMDGKEWTQAALAVQHLRNVDHLHGALRALQSQLSVYGVGNLQVLGMAAGFAKDDSNLNGLVEVRDRLIARGKELG